MSATMAEPTGREVGRKLLLAVRGYLTRSLREVADKMDAMQRSIDQTPTLEIMRGEIDAAIRERLQAPEPEPVNVEAILQAMNPMIEAAIARAVLDVERRSQGVLERAIDRMPRPKDGEDGKDGVYVEDFDVAQNERQVIIGVKLSDGQVFSRELRLEYPIYRDVFQSGRIYEKADQVTYSGSTFIATRNTTGKEVPEKSDAWKLVTKRGQNGKSAPGADE